MAVEKKGKAQSGAPLCAALMDKSLVTKATSPDEIPTPGYMFNEIARITQASADASKVRAPQRVNSVSLSLCALALHLHTLRHHQPVCFCARGRFGASA